MAATAVGIMAVVTTAAIPVTTATTARITTVITRIIIIRTTTTVTITAITYHHTGWAHHGGWGGWGGGGWGGWGWGSPWVGAGFGAAATWLGLEGLNNATPIVGNYGGPAVVDNNDETTDNVATNTPNNNTPNNNTVPQTQTADTDDEESDDEPEISDAQRAEADKLLKSGATDPAKGTQFLPLGVFSLAPQGQEKATALAQLAISKDGAVRGTYHDLLSNHDQPIRGAVDKKSQRVVFSFGDKGKVTVETSLANLTQKTGGALVHSADGETSQWTLARFDKEPTAEDDAEDSADEAADDAEDKADTAKETAPEAPSAPAIN